MPQFRKNLKYFASSENYAPYLERFIVRHLQYLMQRNCCSSFSETTVLPSAFDKKNQTTRRMFKLRFEYIFYTPSYRVQKVSYDENLIWLNWMQSRCTSDSIFVFHKIQSHKVTYPGQFLAIPIEYEVLKRHNTGKFRENRALTSKGCLCEFITT